MSKDEKDSIALVDFGKLFVGHFLDLINRTLKINGPRVAGILRG